MSPQGEVPAQGGPVGAVGAAGAAPGDGSQKTVAGDGSQTQAVPAAPAGEVATRFDPDPLATHLVMRTVDVCAGADSGHLKYLIRGSIRPLPSFTEDTCDNLVVRLRDETQHLYIDTVTAKNSTTNVDCSFEETLDIDTKTAAKWDFFVGHPGVVSPQLHVMTSYSPDNLLVLANFGAGLGNSVFYNPNISYSLSQNCPGTTTTLQNLSDVNIHLAPLSHGHFILPAGSSGNSSEGDGDSSLP